MFSHLWHRLHVFPRLALVTCFPALGTGCMFSRAWPWLHVFPRLALVTCFHAYNRLYVFPHLAPVGGSTFSRVRGQLQVLPRLTRVACIPLFASVARFTAHGTNKSSLVPRRLFSLTRLAHFAPSRVEWAGGEGLVACARRGISGCRFSPPEIRQSAFAG